jgi:hypothetical protein
MCRPTHARSTLLSVPRTHYASEAPSANLFPMPHAPKTTMNRPFTSSKEDRDNKLARLTWLQLVRPDLTGPVPVSLFYLLPRQHNPPPSCPWQPLQCREPAYGLVLIMCPPIRLAQIWPLTHFMTLKIPSHPRVPPA